MRALIPVLLIVVASSAAASDFDDAVDYVEQQWRAERVRIPFLGAGLFLASAMGAPLGARDFRIAIFENASPRRTGEAAAPLELSEGWRPLVRQRSRGGRRETAIYARDEGSWTRLIVMNVDGEDAAVIQCRIRPDRLAHFVKHHRHDAD